jgi:hypothetical protein
VRRQGGGNDFRQRWGIKVIESGLRALCVQPPNSTTEEGALTPIFSSQRHNATITARKIPKPGKENHRDQKEGCGGLTCAPGTIRLLRAVLLTTILGEREMLTRIWRG